MKKYINKIISIFLLISLVVSNLPLGAILAYVRPSIAVSSPSKSSVNVGDSVSYTVTYSNADYINLSSSYVTLNGFTANIYVSGNGDSRTITLSNIQGSAGKKSISIAAGTAENENGYTSSTPNSVAFTLNNNVDIIRPSISVSSPSKSSVNVGESVSYTLSFTDNVSVARVNTSASYITLNGFTADIYVSNTSNKSVITLSNVQGSAGRKSISIKAGTALDSAGNIAAAIDSTVAFNLNTPNTNGNNNSGNNNTNTGVQNVDNLRPTISISSPSANKVYKGSSLTYTVNFADNKGIDKINLSAAYVNLNGFTANVNITGRGLNRLITLSNIQGSVGKKSISIKAGAVLDSAGNSNVLTSNSVSFEIIEKQVTKPAQNNNKVTVNNNANNNSNNIDISSNDNTTLVQSTIASVVKSTPKLINTCEDSIEVLGDINKEVKTFSTRFTSEKNLITYAQENNYVAKNEEITYIVDYYNGKDKDAKNVNIKLTIPYNVDVLEVNAGGKILSQTASQTVIEWDKGTIKKEEKCRLYVKVKYLQNTLLEKSDKISEEFYVTVNTKYDSKNEITYLRQLFIDNNSNKIATINKYLTAIDSTNSIRPDDKITRAELAKLLVDTGILQVENGNTDYKKYKDAEEIPAYARDAVSALYGTGIIEEFSDSEFKPNNPIVRDEFFKIVAKAASYISNGKLETKKPTFIYTDIIDDKDKSICSNKDYIMELIRINVIKKQDVRPDEYTLRKEAVEIINALTFRGPYVHQIESNVLKFVDMSENNSCFYDIVGASNTYVYSYTDTLWQKITNVK